MYNQPQIFFGKLLCPNYCAQTIRLIFKKTKIKFQGESFSTVLGYLPIDGLESRKTWPMDVYVGAGAWKLTVLDNNQNDLTEYNGFFPDRRPLSSKNFLIHLRASNSNQWKFLYPLYTSFLYTLQKSLGLYLAISRGR